MKTPRPRLRARISSFIWRALSRYGKFKYDHLLPLYRIFGLLPKLPAAAGGARPRPSLRLAQSIARRLGSAGGRPDQLDLDTIIQRAMTSKGAIIFLPSVGWETVNTQRGHHLAREFARQGYVSIYDCSGTYTDVSGFREIADNLFLYRGDASALGEIPEATLWTLTYNFDQVKQYWPAARTVYDWIDDLSVFPFDRNFLEENHRQALFEATLVVSVARRLHEQALAVRSDALYLPNGVAYDHFASPARLPHADSQVNALLTPRRPIAGYYGALAEWFDYELLAAVAEQRRDWSFLLIGPMLDASARQRGRSLFKRANVHWVGARPYAQLPEYLRLFDVALIPFVVNNITKATSPLKLYEYMAAARPIITTPMPECEGFSVVTIIQDAEEMARALDQSKAQGASEAFREQCRALAREHSWERRVQTVAKALNHKIAISPPPSGSGR
jgi:glycosyltransferase involved in cell wall biosynthesis